MVVKLIILLMAVPTGFLISWLARDELVVGRKWFRVLIIVSFLGTIWFYLTGFDYISLSFMFILIVSAISYTKSFDKRWVG